MVRTKKDGHSYKNFVTQHCVGKVDTRPLKLTGQPTLLSQCSPASLRDAAIPKVR